MTLGWVVPDEEEGPVDAVLQVLARAREAQFIPGGIVGVVRPGPTPDLAQTQVVPFGVADVDTRRPVEVHTTFEIGSLSKIFTAAVLASTVADPTVPVDLGTELRTLTSARVPGAGGDPITLEHLVTHRSGLPRMPPDKPVGPLERAGYRPDQLWAALGVTRLLAPPGSSWLYSNFAFGILGTVLSERAGRPFGALVAEVVCGPLGMTSTTLEPAPARTAPSLGRWWHREAPGAQGDVSPATATGYREGSTASRPIVASSWNNTGALAGSGGLISTGTDMTTFLTAAAGYGSGPATAVLARTRRHLPAPSGPDHPRMGMAWQFRPTPTCGTVWFKNGGTSGMHCAMAVLPRETGANGGHGVVVLTNGPDHVDELAVDLLAAVIAGG